MVVEDTVDRLPLPNVSCRKKFEVDLWKKDYNSIISQNVLLTYFTTSESTIVRGIGM